MLIVHNRVLWLSGLRCWIKAPVSLGAWIRITLLPSDFGLLSGSNGKGSACSAGDWGLIPGLGRSPGEGNDNPLQYSCLENSHGQRSLVGYSQLGRKESDMTEELTLSLSFFISKLATNVGFNFDLSLII